MKKINIVVVEDEQLIALDITETLKNMGHNVCNIYRRGEDAVANILEDDPDIVFMDIELAGEMNGIQTAKEIEARIDIPIIYLTAYADDDFLERAKVTTPYGYIIKPFEQRALQANMEMALYHHKMEQVIKKSEAQYRAVVEDQKEFIIRFTKHGKLTFVNQSYGNFKNSTSDKLLGKNWLEELPESDRQHCNKLFAELTPRNPVINHILTTKLSDGSTQWIDWSFRAIFDDKQKFLEYQAVGRDITQRKKAEIERDKIQEQLFQAQKMEVVGRLAGGIAHDFNNLLTAINGYTDLAKTKIEPEHPAFRDLNVIGETADKAEILIKQLLGFSRKQIVKKQVIDVNEHIRNLHKLLVQMTGKDIELHLELATEELHIKIDPNQLDQILINLVVNARDAMENSGNIIIKSEISKIPPKISKIKGIDQNAKFIRISVIDEGCGMDQQTKKKIFEPFFTTKAKDKGTGLGLATVFSIVQQNNGDIDVETEPGMGSTFRLYFPETEEALKKKEVRQRSVKKQIKKSSTILVVEDEHSLRDLMLDILKETPHRIVEAENGINALEILNKRKPEIDLMITDIQMPQMDGYQLAKEFIKLYPQAKILFVSGHTNNRDILKDIAENKVNFLHKPFNYQSFIDKITDIL